MTKSLHDVSLDSLRVFHQVASTGSMTAAARALFVTQPAVSHTIAHLEEHLQCRLFDRTGRRLILTETGRTLFATTQNIVATLSQGDRELKDIESARAGILKIGCPFLLLKTALTPFLAAFHKTHPQVRIQVEIENRMQPMLELVKSRKVDLLFLATPETRRIASDLVEETLDTYRYALFASRTHFPELEHKVLDLSDINAYPIVILRRGNNTRDTLESLFARAGLTLHAEYDTATMAITEEFTKAGFGIGAMLVSNHPVVPVDDPGLFEIQTREPLPEGRYAALYRADTSLPACALAFLDLVREQLTKRMCTVSQTHAAPVPTGIEP